MPHLCQLGHALVMYVKYGMLQSAALYHQANPIKEQEQANIWVLLHDPVTFCQEDKNHNLVNNKKMSVIMSYLNCRIIAVAVLCILWK